MNQDTIKILIVDDHVVFVNGLHALLEKTPGLAIVGTAYNGKDALEKLEKLDIDLVITDISMPGMNGLDLLSRIKSSYPTLKVMVLTMHSEVSIVKSVMKLNPDAFLLKNTDGKELLQAIEAVESGKPYYSEEIKTLLIDNLRGVTQGESVKMIPSLSKRETEVLGLIAQEMTTSEIADQLFLSLHTIETYRKNLLRKLDAKNSVGLVAKAYQLGLIK